jgi:MFS family permease
VFSLFLYLTLYLQNVERFDPLQAGLRLLPISVASFVVAPIAGRASEKVPVRLLIGGGLAVSAVGLALFTRLSPTSGWTALLPGLIVGGVGIGMVNPPLASTAIGVAPQGRAGMASGVNNTFRQVGIATGIAGLGTVFQSHVTSNLVAQLQGTPLAARAGDLSQAISSGAIGTVVRHVPPAARQRLAEASTSAFVSSLDTLFWISTVVAAVGAVLSVSLVRGRDFERVHA